MIGHHHAIRMLAILCLAGTPVAAAQPMPSPAPPLVADAPAYAALYGVSLDEADRRLRAQLETAATTEALATEFADRLAGIAIAHDPWRIVVLLTGDVPVAPRIVPAGGMTVPILFRTGAPATRAALLAALAAYQGELRVAVRQPPGMGVDPRTGTLVMMVSAADLEREGEAALVARLSAIAGVPVRLRVIARPELDMAGHGAAQGAAPADATVDRTIDGGARVVGVSAIDGRRYVCTTGFAVTDGVRGGVVTAAHCPDTLRYVDGASGAGEVSLDFVGQWGWGYQDVQLNTGAATFAPFFRGDADKALRRPVTGQRSRAQTRAGDIVCHRGERTGYSCATVELTDFAPAGDLCGGACTPSWVTVAGPTCKAGDSGAPVYLGTTAYGIVKGGTYRADGSCAFYFYMSVDYLPTGWSLVRAPVGM